MKGRPETRRWTQVVVTASLIVTLSFGGAYAADKIGSGDIARNAILSKHIRPGQVRWRDLAPGVREQLRPSLPQVVVSPPSEATAPNARVQRKTNQTVPREQFTPVTFPDELWDNEELHEPGSSRLVAKEPGTYLVQGFFTFEGNEDGLRTASLIVNGDPTALTGAAYAEQAEAGNAAPGTGAGGNALSLAAPIPMRRGDYVQMWAWQNSNSSLNIMGDRLHRAELAMVRIAPPP